jgi:phosphopantothenoylcysteine decarboxylase/phosphopantothenate--cysteine ligase
MPDEVSAAPWKLRMSTALTGLRIVVSAGPTYEDIDPVRFIGNRSSGKMGFAIAAAAARRGAQVRLIAGPVHQPTPHDVQRTDVRSAAQMHAAVLSALPADVYIGAAAVADFTPRSFAGSKIKKQPGEEGLTLQLVRTRDILADVAAHPQRPRLVLGFAAETDEVERYARGKLERKRVDLIAANRVGVEGSGFESDDNALQLFWPGGERALGPASKQALADALLDLIGERLAAKTPLASS